VRPAVIEWTGGGLRGGLARHDGFLPLAAASADPSGARCRSRSTSPPVLVEWSVLPRRRMSRSAGPRQRRGVAGAHPQHEPTSSQTTKAPQRGAFCWSGRRGRDDELCRVAPRPEGGILDVRERRSQRVVGPVEDAVARCSRARASGRNDRAIRCCLQKRPLVPNGPRGRRFAYGVVDPGGPRRTTDSISHPRRPWCGARGRSTERTGSRASNAGQSCSPMPASHCQHGSRARLFARWRRSSRISRARSRSTGCSNVD
jgi:hypothetical protein